MKRTFDIFSSLCGILLIAPEKIRLGLWYVDHRNLWVDLRILWVTVASVLLRLPIKL